MNDLQRAITGLGMSGSMYRAVQAKQGRNMSDLAIATVSFKFKKDLEFIIEKTEAEMPEVMLAMIMAMMSISIGSVSDDPIRDEMKARLKDIMGEK